MERIASFCVNHDVLVEGMYTSRVDGDIITYDIRMAKPNGGNYLENAQMHTYEHLFATYARNSELSHNVIYVGPMGCRTGFYLLMRNTAPGDAIALVQNAAKFIADYEGDIPGATAIECGNYKEQDLASAKALGAKMSDVLKNWTVEKLVYLP